MKRIYQHSSKKNAVGTYETIVEDFYGSQLTLELPLGTYLLTKDLTLTVLVFVGIFICGLYCNLKCLLHLFVLVGELSRRMYMGFAMIIKLFKLKF